MCQVTCEIGEAFGLRAVLRCFGVSDIRETEIRERKSETKNKEQRTKNKEQRTKNTAQRLQVRLACILHSITPETDRVCFWTEENAESMMLMRANILSEQWDKEVAETRNRWRTGGGKDYRWKAENILKYVKPEFPKEDEMFQTPEISDKADIAA